MPESVAVASSCSENPKARHAKAKTRTRLLGGLVSLRGCREAKHATNGVQTCEVVHTNMSSALAMEVSMHVASLKKGSLLLRKDDAVLRL
jgi:hypothetical protein